MVSIYITSVCWLVEDSTGSPIILHTIVCTKGSVASEHKQMLMSLKPNKIKFIDRTLCGGNSHVGIDTGGANRSIHLMTLRDP